jgi:CRISPR/Cas system-associated endonuclease Cas1
MVSAHGTPSTEQLLFVSDGVGEHRHERRFDKATHGLRRVVLLASTGLVTIDAFHWCSRLGIGVVVLAPDGTARLTSSPRLTDDARLRRTQALALSDPHGLDVARWLISRKLVGHGKVLLSRFGEADAAETLGDLALGVEEAAGFDEIRQVGAAAAGLYFAVWWDSPSACRCSPRRTGDVSRPTGHATRGVAWCSFRRFRTGRPSDR